MIFKFWYNEKSFFYLLFNVIRRKCVIIIYFNIYKKLKQNFYKKIVEISINIYYNKGADKVCS